jgi:NAD(P)-dependent dehydrogenase (short-subunit alcohol dehydrogenase family)
VAEFAAHALVVGGTGMLAPAVRALRSRGWRVSVLARRASAFVRREPGLMGLDCNYNDAEAFASTLDRARDGEGPIMLAVGWFHAPGPPSVLAPRMGVPGAPGRLFHVLGSAAADPAQPEALARAAKTAEGAPWCLYRQVVLGFVAGETGSRWLTNDEISTGVLKAVDEDAPLSIVGETRPWSARP